MLAGKYHNLPASQIADAVNDALVYNGGVVVTASPGAGKSTLLPLTILESLSDGSRILMLEPRRLAARQIQTLSPLPHSLGLWTLLQSAATKRKGESRRAKGEGDGGG